MARFNYTGRDSAGAAVTGLLDGDSPSAIARILQGRGVTPVSIVEARAETKSAAPAKRRSRRPPALEDMMFFCRQMHTLTRSGVPLIRGIGGLAETARNDLLADALRAIIRDLEAGYGLSRAFGQHPKIFSPFFVGVLQVGENSGRMDEAFQQLSAYMERERDTRNRIKAAMRYPTMVIFAITAAMVVINLFVMPAFAKVFKGFNAELPWATRILLGVSDFTVQNWPLLLAGLVLAGYGWVRFIGGRRGRLWWDRSKLRLPVVGPLLLKATVARFARSFATAQRSGVPLIQGLTLLTAAVENAHVAELLQDMRRSIERGNSIVSTAAGLKLFPPLVMQMIEVGEESGRLDEMLDEVADFYDAEIDIDLKNLSSAIEPILLLVVGGMVLILALGVFLPLWDLGKVSLRH